MKQDTDDDDQYLPFFIKAGLGQLWPLWYSAGNILKNTELDEQLDCNTLERSIRERAVLLFFRQADAFVCCLSA